ncbi:formate dehydrogenase accessory protein FdhE [Burkholderia ubonensis]|uniref:formate dehydrogenase accessory protein FdhE n=1 Tax=Burkholderia ubonensis TaxID=101571 RepID=UPI000BA65B4F|nr:formate dehydrogenase accessory protein FdhE [Burkholderia ubonensis]PAK14184.1 formate dehydrogenase accessory protein FdhE [Burkholderia ubonensis]RQP32724.1 formate dehydrogenase accessory protein FdhE [Burkholderia ubonensis]RQP39302.1 formate dehydrogenase accessory protein FdhE [Burkholderia ubonensis]RQP44879.1 formate dehydrogenase accessory protein FdhE [Burkholderia ubonensis]RQP58540.1 formate dehydrogenase accessory protein FdhE [Burkholderia ubonensis]
MTQRILEPNEISALDHSAIPRFRLPERATIFSARAARLRQLADLNPISGYLRLMAVVADAQHAVLQDFAAQMPSQDAIARAQQHSMPLVPALGGERDPQWRAVLYELLDRVEGAGLVNPPLAKLLDRLRLMAPAELDAQADAILALRFAEVDPATAPFLMAALQVVWTDLASRTQPADVPFLDQPGLCPVCGTHPVASVVRVGGQYEGYRFLQCGLCTTEWHMVRTKCSHCDSTKGIAYHGIEGGSEAVKAESCDECKTYRKIGYQNKDYDFEPLADDLASLTLDLLMNEAGYQRSSPNPLLWPEAPREG